MKKLVLFVLAAVLVAPCFTSCKKEETLGDKIDAAVSEAKDAADDAADKAKDAADEAGKKLKELGK